MTTLAAPWRFLWLNDVHIGRYMTYSAGEPANLIAHANTLGCRFAVVPGDLTESSTAAQFAEYRGLMAGLDLPRFDLPGNHDEGPGDHSGDEPNAADWSIYESEIGPRRWAFRSGALALIGFSSEMVYTPDPYRGHGRVQPADLEFVEGQLIAAAEAGLAPVLCTHFPLYEEFWPHIWYGGDELRAMCETYGVRLVLSGHRHLACLTATHGQTTEVSGGSVAYVLEQAGRSGYMVVDVYADRLVVRFADARAPFAEYGPGLPGIPYTPIEIPL